MKEEKYYTRSFLQANTRTQHKFVMSIMSCYRHRRRRGFEVGGTKSGAKLRSHSGKHWNCENNMNVTISSYVRDQIPSGSAPSVGEHGSPCRKLHLSDVHLAKFACRCMSYHVGLSLGPKNLGTLPKVAGPCSTVKKTCLFPRRITVPNVVIQAQTVWTYLRFPKIWARGVKRYKHISIGQ